MKETEEDINKWKDILYTHRLQELMSKLSKCPSYPMQSTDSVQ